ncbi:MAG: hypothetical protein V4659_09355 [Pseudomonadota bacterium]
MDDPAPRPEPGPEAGLAVTSFAARRPRRSWRTVTLIAVVAFLVGLGAMTLVMRGYQRWTAPAAAPAPQVVAAAAPASTFMPRSPLTASGSASDLETLSAREVALTGRIAELEARLASVGTAAQGAAGNANRAEGLLIAFAARRALDRGLGLGYIEAQLRDRFGPVQPQAVATVVAAARQPVTLEDLRVGIEAIAPQLATGNTTDGWWASLRREVSDLVVIRRDTAPSPRASDRLVRARRMLEGGQVEGALAEIARLPGAESGDRWIAAAKRYIGARGALDTIETAAIMGQGRDPYVPAASPAPVGDPVTGAPLPR